MKLYIRTESGFSFLHAFFPSAALIDTSKNPAQALHFTPITANSSATFECWAAARAEGRGMWGCGQAAAVMLPSLSQALLHTRTETLPVLAARDLTCGRAGCLQQHP